MGQQLNLRLEEEEREERKEKKIIRGSSLFRNIKEALNSESPPLKKKLTTDLIT